MPSVLCGLSFKLIVKTSWAGTGPGNACVGRFDEARNSTTSLTLAGDATPVLEPTYSMEARLGNGSLTCRGEVGSSSGRLRRPEQSTDRLVSLTMLSGRRERKIEIHEHLWRRGVIDDWIERVQDCQLVGTGGAVYAQIFLTFHKTRSYSGAADVPAPTSVLSALSIALSTAKALRLAHITALVPAH